MGRDREQSVEFAQFSQNGFHRSKRWNPLRDLRAILLVERFIAQLKKVNTRGFLNWLSSRFV
jgi:hypothetical protein